MEFREFTGKTIDDAIIEAATSLGVATSNLETQVVFKGSMGFLGIGAKPAVIKARPKNTETIDDILTDTMTEIETEKKSDAEKPVKEKAPKTERTEKAPTVEKTEPPKEDAQPVVIDESIIDDTKEYLKKLFAAMELEADITVELDKDTRTLNIDVEGPEMGIIIGKRGQTLDSLQYLINLYVNKKSNTHIRVKLDTENYRERRKETLETLAKNIAFKVKKSRRSFTLEPMNPYERRIIHSTLQGEKYVATKSEGEEPYRRVVVFYKRNAK
ncbi:MAG: protein jag [Eubacterium sp.]|nr:protein jag [Eubacterium sp.]